MPVTDLASNDVHDRTLSSAIFILIPAILAQTYIVGTMDFATIPSMEELPDSIHLFNKPTVGGILLGERMMFPLKARVLNKLSYPVRNYTLTARIASWTPSSPDYDFCSTVLENNATLEGVRFSEICSLTLEGYQVVTDADGVATFFDLRFSRGVPSLVTLEVSLEACGGFLAGVCSVPIFRNVSLGIQLLSSALRLQSLSSAPVSLLTDTPVSTHPPLVAVTDAYGSPQAGVPVVAFSVGNVSQFGTRVQGHLLRRSADFVVFGSHPRRPGDAPKIAVLTGAVALTDANGVADFSNLRVIAANSRSQTVGFYALGSFDLWNSVDETPDGRLMVHEVTLVEPEEDPATGSFNPSLHSLRAVPRGATLDGTAWETRGRSVEGEVMVGVTAQVGVPTEGPVSLSIAARPGKRVVAAAIPHYAAAQEAEVVALAGEEVGKEAMLLTRRWRPFKTLLNAVSEPSDALGVARFTDMRFSREGAAGVYRLRLFVNGEEDPHEFVWEVASSVAKVEVNTSAEIQALEARQSSYGCITEGRRGCEAMGLVPRPGLCKTQDEAIVAMKALNNIPLAQQSDLDRAIGALGDSLESDRQLPCRAAAPLTEPAVGQFLVRLLDAQGEPLDGKEVEMWVKPLNDDPVPGSVLFHPGNAYLRARVHATPLGRGLYAVGPGDARLLRAQEAKPSSMDCAWCTNAPFAYAFTADGFRSASASALPFRRVAVMSQGSVGAAESRCGVDPVPVQLVERRNGTVLPPQLNGFCADVVVETPLPPTMIIGQNSGVLKVRALNASGRGVPGLEVCLGWRDEHLATDTPTRLLQEHRGRNPTANRVRATCLADCLTRGFNLSLCWTPCLERSVQESGGLCNVTKEDGRTELTYGMSFTYPAGLLPWHFFVRNPLLDIAPDISTPETLFMRCLQERTGLPEVCKSDEYWTIVESDAVARFVDFPSLTIDEIPSYMPIPRPVRFVQAGHTAEIDVFLRDGEGLGVDRRTTYLQLIRAPALYTPLHRELMSPVPAVRDPGDLDPFLTSQKGFVCIGGLGCNAVRGLTDGGFAKISLGTDAKVGGTYYLCLGDDKLCVRVRALPALPVPACQPSLPLPAGFLMLVDIDSWAACAEQHAAEIRLLNDPVLALPALPMDGSELQGTAFVAVGSRLPVEAAVLVKGIAGDGLDGFRVQAHVEVAEHGASAWHTTRRLALRGDWSAPSNQSGVAVLHLGVDWADAPPDSRFRVSFSVMADEERLLTSRPTEPFAVVDGGHQGLHRSLSLPAPSKLTQASTAMAPGLSFSPVIPRAELVITPPRGARSAGFEGWVPPFVEAFAVPVEGAPPCTFQVGTNIFKTQGARLDGRQQLRVPVALEALRLGPCLNGRYHLGLRAVASTQQASMAPYPSLSALRGLDPPSTALGTAREAFMVSSHSEMQLHIVQPPPSNVTTLAPFYVAVRFTGRAATPLPHVRVNCSLVDNAVWPGVSEAAFDAGGRLGQLQPVRSIINATGADGIAHFQLSLVRADPQVPLRLRFEAVLVSVESSPIRVRHHFAEIRLLRELTADQNLAPFVTVPIGTLSRQGNQLETTTSPESVLAVQISLDTSIDTATIVPAEIGVYDYAGNMVTGLEQRCPAAGCYNNVNDENYEPGVIKLRIRMYLISVNNSILDGVEVNRIEPADLPFIIGYWWYNSRFLEWVPSGYYRFLFEVDGLWVLQENQVWVQNTRTELSLGNILPVERSTIYYYCVLFVVATVPYLRVASSVHASATTKFLAQVICIGAVISISLYLSLDPPCDPDVLDLTALGCTNLAIDPADQREFPVPSWQRLFQSFTLFIAIYICVSLAIYNYLGRFGWFRRRVPLDLLLNFTEIREAKMRHLFSRILLPEKAQRKVEEFEHKQPYDPVQPKPPLLWYEGPIPTRWHQRKQAAVDYVYRWLRRFHRAKNAVVAVHRRVLRLLPFTRQRFHRVSDFMFPQRMFLTVVICCILILTLEFVFSVVHNRTSAIIEVSRPSLLSEVVELNAFALEDSLVRLRFAEGLLPSMSSGGQHLGNRAGQPPGERFLVRNSTCDTPWRDEAPLWFIRHFDRDPTSRLSFFCFMRTFNLRTLVQDASEVHQLSQADRAGPAVRGLDANAWTQSLVSAHDSSEVVAIAISAVLFVASIAGLLLGYRQDAMEARTGSLLNWTVPASPMRASSFVGVQSASFVLGGLAVLMGTYAASFAILWPPLRRYFVELTIVPVIVMASMVAFSYIVQYYLATAKRSPIRAEENANFRYIPRRGYWSLYELFSSFGHLLLGLPLSVFVSTLSFGRQFFRLLRLDMPTYKGQQRRGDPGHEAYRSLLQTDHLLNSPLPSTLALAIHHELMQRRALAEAAQNVSSRVRDKNAAVADAAELERDKKRMAAERLALIPVTRWQLVVFQRSNQHLDLTARRKHKQGPRTAAAAGHAQVSAGDAENDTGVSVMREDGSRGGALRRSPKLSKAGEDSSRVFGSGPGAGQRSGAAGRRRGSAGPEPAQIEVETAAGAGVGGARLPPKPRILYGKVLPRHES